ncbi:MAG: hypothetical protein ACI9UV_001869 [Algoriphagus sp.]|jgi:hypothetical protein
MFQLLKRPRGKAEFFHLLKNASKVLINLDQSIKVKVLFSEVFRRDEARFHFLPQ